MHDHIFQHLKRLCVKVQYFAIYCFLEHYGLKTKVQQHISNVQEFVRHFYTATVAICCPGYQTNQINLFHCILFKVSITYPSERGKLQSTEKTSFYSFTKSSSSAKPVWTLQGSGGPIIDLNHITHSTETD